MAAHLTPAARCLALHRAATRMTARAKRPGASDLDHKLAALAWRLLEQAYLDAVAALCARKVA